MGKKIIFKLTVSLQEISELIYHIPVAQTLTQALNSPSCGASPVQPMCAFECV